MDNVKETIAKNLVELRKSKKWTQQQLAEKINYSDKAISRWEHGESLPDIETLCRICDVFGVSFEYLLQKEQTKPGRSPHVKKSGTGARISITFISVSVVWVIATIAYAYALTFFDANIWTLFIWSLPASGIVVVTCCSIWHWPKLLRMFFSSFTLWTLILSLFLQMLPYNMWMLFIIGVPVQIIIVFASTLKPQRARNEVAISTEKNK